MADIFFTQDITRLFKNKNVVFIGDSNVRALYKDALWLLHRNTLINHNFLRRKLEKSYLGDKLIKGSELSRSRDFQESRCYEGVNTVLSFYFVTRCYCNTIVDYLKDVKEGKCHVPDVVIMNSCLWDISRWGPTGIDDYKENMVKLMNLIKESLPPKSLFIWTTAFPISLSSLRGGLIIKQIEPIEKSLRFHIMEANVFTSNLVSSFGYDVVDAHYHMQYQISRRSADGVHFLPVPVRLMTNHLLTHIAISWGVSLPQRTDFLLIEDDMLLASKASDQKSYQKCDTKFESDILPHQKQPLQRDQGWKRNNDLACSNYIPNVPTIKRTFTNQDAGRNRNMGYGNSYGGGYSQSYLNPSHDPWQAFLGLQRQGFNNYQTDSLFPRYNDHVNTAFSDDTFDFDFNQNNQYQSAQQENMYNNWNRMYSNQSNFNWIRQKIIDNSQLYNMPLLNQGPNFASQNNFNVQNNKPFKSKKQLKRLQRKNKNVHNKK